MSSEQDIVHDVKPKLLGYPLLVGISYKLLSFSSIRSNDLKVAGLIPVPCSLNVRV